MRHQELSVAAAPVTEREIEPAFAGAHPTLARGPVLHVAAESPTAHALARYLDEPFDAARAGRISGANSSAASVLCAERAEDVAARLTDERLELDVEGETTEAPVAMMADHRFGSKARTRTTTSSGIVRAG